MLLGMRGGVRGIPGKLFGVVRGRGAVVGGLTNSLKGSVSAGAVIAGGLTLKRALAGSITGGATFVSNLTGPGIPGVLVGRLPGGAAITGTPTLVPLITATPTGSTLYVSEGDSITAGAGVTSSYSALLASTNTGSVKFSNRAISGNQLDDLVARGDTVDALIAANSGKSSYVLSVMVGTNDAGTNTAGYYPSNAAGFLTAYAAYLDARRAAGYIVVVYTITPRNNSSLDTWIQTVNTGIRGFVGTGHADAVIDIYNDSIMGGFAASQNATLYSDGLHPTQTGDNYIERASAAIISGVMHSVAPTVSSVSISGTAMQGQTASAVVSGVTGHPKPTIAYVWYRNSTQVGTGQTYVFQASDIGQPITVTAQPTNAGGTGSAVMSGSVTPAALPVPVNSTLPTITGAATQDTTFVGGDGTWTNSPTSFARQWYRDNSSTPISGATGSNYTSVLADVGHALIFGVIATNAGGSSSQAYSTATATITASSSAMLDTLSSSATAAYSTRKLKGAYAGSAIKVRRSSDNATQDIGFDSNGDLDVAALTTFVGASSGFIDTWYDQSGSALNLVQATTGNQPRIRNAGTTDTLNGKGAVLFGQSSGVNMRAASGFPSEPISVAALLGQRSGSSFGGILTSGGAAANAFLLLSTNSASPLVSWWNNNGQNTVESTTTGLATVGKQSSYVVMQNTSHDQYIRRSGNQMAAKLSTTNTFVGGGEIMVGNFGGSPASSYVGFLPEIIIFNAMLSDADIQKIDTSHSAYWGTDAGKYQDPSIPAQTAASAPSGYIASADSEFTTPEWIAWHAFSQDIRVHSAWASANATGWVQRQVPSALTLTGYAITTDMVFSHPPQAWNFQGSNDGITWTTLDSRSAQTNWVQGERRVYAIAAGSRGAYTYYRLNITTSNTTVASVAELEFVTS